MKFKSVQRGGPRAGEVIEYSPEEKVPAVLQDAVIDHESFKDKEHVWVRDVKLDKLDFISKGDPLKGKYANNRYDASGTFTIHRRSLKNDSLMQPRKRLFRVKFDDVCDSLGKPDLAVIEFELRDP